MQLHGEWDDAGLALLRLAQGNVEAAGAAVRRMLEETKDARSRARLHAAAAHAYGAVALEAGESGAVLELLRNAFTAWQELRAPYEIARSRELIGRAYRVLGDEEGAQLEFDAAKDVFDRLGAAPDAARVAAVGARPPGAISGALTGRQVEVLRLVATGKTNRAIALELSISEKTVAVT